MEQVVNFRDYQEAISDDFNNIQNYAQQSLDDLVHDAVTASIRYSGFNVSTTGTAEITVAPGRFYGPNPDGEVGAVFISPNNTIIELVSFLAVATQKYVTLAAYGQLDQIDQETRDYVTNITTGQTTPQVVSMTASRDAILTIVQGSEGPTPVPPAVPATQVAIANILLSNTGIVSVTMLTGQAVTSTENLNNRLTVVEAFDTQVENQVSTLTADLATLANEIGAAGNDRPLIIELMQDMALVKTTVSLPASYAQYGASYFLWADGTQFDITNAEALGFNCQIKNGIRFPWQNSTDMAISMFNPLDPNGKLNTSTGLLLPAYTEVIKLQTANLPQLANAGATTAAVINSVPIGQYGYQTFTQKQLNIPYTQIQNGGSYATCSNGASIYTPAASSTQPYWLPNFSSYSVVSNVDFVSDGQVAPDYAHSTTYYNYLTIDSWTEPYWTLEAVPQSINGALIAQSMLIGSDMWITRIGVFLTAVASATAINFALCQVTDGVPDLTTVMATGQIIGTAVTTGMNYLEIAPTFLQQGMRIAVVIYSMANHSIGLVAPGSYNGGTFFYSLDGAYFLGDLTKLLAVQLWGCQFNASQVDVQLNTLNLEGGIRDINITARMQIPGACELVFSVQPVGSSTWIPISPDAPLAPFQSAPTSANFKATFIGTPSIMPGLVLTDSLLLLDCPGPTLTFVSKPETLQVASANITLKLQLEAYNPTAHTCTAKLYTGAAPYIAQNPTTTTTTIIEAEPNAADAGAGTYEMVLTFTGFTAVTSFIIEITGTTNSVADTFLVADMVWYAQ